MKHPARIFFALVCLICVIGLGAVFTASVAEAFSQFGDKFYFARKQLLWLSVGMGAFGICAFLPSGFFKKIAPLVFGIGLAMTALLLLPGVGKTVQGAQRWLTLGPLTVQPAELLKLGIALYFPLWLLKHQRLLSFLLIMGVIFFLLIIQPDMGTALVTSLIGFGLYVGAGAKLKNIAAVMGLGLLSVIILIAIAPYRMERVTTFLKMESDPLGASYHIRQITIALGSGGWFGVGAGQSKQKYQYIPEASTDSIFAILGEEFGFAGGVVVFGLYALVLHAAFRIVEQADDGYEKLLALGVTLWIGAHALLNLAAVVSLVPLTGVPLPFISYGGSSLVTMLAGSGILVSIGRSRHT